MTVVQAFKAPITNAPAVIVGANAPTCPFTTMTQLGHYLRDAVLYEDAHMLAINKPAGVPVHAGGHALPHIDGALNATITSAHSRVNAHLVHRLDRDTSGVLLLAKTTTAARRLANAFMRRTVEKNYWAVVNGKAPLLGHIDLPLASRADEFNMMMVDYVGGKAATTDFSRLALLGDDLSLVSLKPKTGRTHQLRVHMAALDTPILGDPKYGLPQSPALMLHLLARQLTVPHPDDGQVTIIAPTPSHFNATFSRYGGVELQKSGLSL